MDQKWWKEVLGFFNQVHFEIPENSTNLEKYKAWWILQENNTNVIIEEVRKSTKSIRPENEAKILLKSKRITKNWHIGCNINQFIEILIIKTLIIAYLKICRNEKI